MAVKAITFHLTDRCHLDCLHCLRDPGQRLNRYDGRPISPEQVYATTHQILGTPVRLTECGAIDTTEEA